MWWLLLHACSPETPPPPATEAIHVFAASSLMDVLPKVGEAWSAETGNSVTFTFDASSRLAKQLESGAAADVFLSADEEWMRWAADRSLVGASTPLLGNSLVVVVPSGSSFVPSDAAGLADPRIQHLALAGENVPAGRYARASLRRLGAWDGVSARVVDGDSVRTALGWVAGGEAEAGIVYATDARAQPRVQVAFTFPPDSHPPIVYPGAVTSSSKQPDAATSFLGFCGTGGKALFEEAGFVVLAP